MKNYQGKVDGIDVMAIFGQESRCYAFINRDEENYIQVTTTDLNLQLALQLACANGVEVEVGYEEEANLSFLTRVRLLDR